MSWRAVLLASILLIGCSTRVGAAPAAASISTTSVSACSPSILPTPLGPGPYPLESATDSSITAAPNARHLSLDEAVKTALERNLALETLSLGPAIGNAEIGVQQSAFNAVPFVTLSHTVVSNAYTQALGNLFVNDTSAVGYRRLLEDGSKYTLQYQIRQIQGLNTNISLTTAAFTLTRPLRRGAGLEATLAQLDAARDLQRQGVQGVNVRAEGLVANVEAAYWQLVQSQKIVEAREKSILQYQHLLDVTETRIKAGEAAPYERIAISQQLAIALQNLILARQDVNLADLQVRRLLRLDLSGPPLTVDSLPTFTPEAKDVEHLIEVAKEHRPEIEQAALTAHTLHLQTVVSQNLALPREDLTLTLEVNPFLGAQNRVQIGFQYQPPTGRAAVVNAQLKEQQAVVAAQDIVRQVAEDVASSARSLTNLTDRLNAATEVRKLTEALASIEEVRYESGLNAIDVVLRVQHRVQDAIALEAEAEREYAEGIAGLDRATGVALEKYGISVDSLADHRPMRLSGPPVLSPPRPTVLLNAPPVVLPSILTLPIGTPPGPPPPVTFPSPTVPLTSPPVVLPPSLTGPLAAPSGPSSATVAPAPPSPAPSPSPTSSEPGLH